MNRSTAPQAALILLLLAAHVAILNLPPFLPWPDTPFHLAAATIRADYNVATTPYRDYYELTPLGVRPNLTFYLAASSGWLGRPLVAARVLYALYVVSTIGLVAACIRSLGGSLWLTLLAFPFLYNLSVSYGFAEFTAAVPVALGVLWTAMQVARRPHWGWYSALATGLVLLFLCHAIAVIFGLLFTGLFLLLLHHRRLGRLLAGALTLVPALACLAAWYAGRTRGSGGWPWIKGYYRDYYLVEFGTRLADIFRLDNDRLVSPQLGPWIAAAFTVAVLVALAATLYRAARVRNTTVRKLLRDWRTQPTSAALAAFLVTAAGVVLFAPSGYPPFWSIYQRFTVMLWLGLIFLTAQLLGRDWCPRPAVRATLLLVCLAHVGLWGEHFRAYRAEARDLLTVLRAAPHDGVLGFTAGDPSFRGEPEAFVHAGNYHTVVNGSMAISALPDFPYTQVQRRVGEAALPNALEARTAGPDYYRNYPCIQRVLAREPLPTSAKWFRTHFAPLTRAGRWTLYQRTGDAPTSQP